MEKIQVSAYFEIPPDRLAEFKQLASQCIERVKEKDTGTHQYDWFMNADETACEVREIYADSNALLEHIAHVGDLLGPLFAIGPLRLHVYGNVSDELRKATAELGPAMFTYLGGL